MTGYTYEIVLKARKELLQRLGSGTKIGRRDWAIGL